jgi:hypothetical protein
MKKSISTQVEEDIGPIISINKINVNSEDVDRFLKSWAADAAIFKQQPGYISAQLHRGFAGSCVFVAYRPTVCINDKA